MGKNFQDNLAYRGTRYLLENVPMCCLGAYANDDITEQTREASDKSTFVEVEQRDDGYHF